MYDVSYDMMYIVTSKTNQKYNSHNGWVPVPLISHTESKLVLTSPKKTVNRGTHPPLGGPPVTNTI